MSAVLSLLAASLTLVVKTGMSPGENPLAVAPIDGLKGAVEVVDAKGRTVPCAVRKDGDGRRFVAFRLGAVEILRRLEFRVRETAGAQADLSDIPRNLPGMNLVVNPDLSLRDKKGDPVGWWPSPGFAKRNPWTDETRANLRTANGVVGLQNGCWVTYLTGLEEGHVYRFSFDGLCKAKRGGLTVWYCGKDGRWPSPLPGVGNYKSSHGISKTGEWTHVEDSSFLYFDKKAKRHILNNRELLPGTGAAYLQVYAEEGRIGLRNIRYEDVTSDSGIKVEVSEVPAD